MYFEICNPDDKEECAEVECDEAKRCCIEGSCADCSDATLDSDEFNPDVCIPEGEEGEDVDEECLNECHENNDNAEAFYECIDADSEKCGTTPEFIADMKESNECIE